MKLRSRSAAFTLLELLVVLAILAIVTGLAVRSIDGVEDQRRFDASEQLIGDIENAVIGSDEYDAAYVTGFLADMGRLPKSAGEPGLTLAELWERGSLPEFDVRDTPLDSEIKVSTGWRGPYLRMPLGADRLLDSWGNPIHSRDVDGNEIAAAGVNIAIVRHFGANGVEGSGDEGYKRDREVDFRGLEASVNAEVQVVNVVDDATFPVTIPSTDKVIVRVFGPDPASSAGVQVLPAGEPVYVTLQSTSVPTFQIEGAMPGPRAVRAYLYNADASVLLAKSAIKRIILRPGVNSVSFTIRRP